MKQSGSTKRAGGITYKEAGVAVDPAMRAGAINVPVICLHGIGGNADSFAPQMTALSDQARVIAWNMPGYGGSERLRDTTFAGLSTALADFMDDLGIETAHLIGHSIGGMIALEFALTYPSRVKSLALIATTSAFGGREETFKQEFLRARLEPLEQGRTMAELAAAFVPEIVGAMATSDVIAEATASMAAVPPDSYRAILSCLTTFNRRNDLEKLDLPVCLIAGSEDNNAPAKTMIKMAGKMPHADCHVIEGAGHLVNLEAADQTNDILTTFYNS